jgi:predicted dehydrogenase
MSVTLPSFSAPPPVNIGFIGCGNHATLNVYPCLRFADCELIAVADLDERKRTLTARHYGAKKTYSDYQQMLEEAELDAVFVIGPPQLHYEAALAVLEHGLPVFVEKPPAPTLAQTLELREAARRAGTFIMVGFMKRFAQKYRAAMALTEQPEFGKKTHLFLRYSHPMRGEPLPVLTLMSIHALDLMRHFMGEVERLHVERGTVPGTMNTNLLVEFTSGATGSIVLNNTLPGVLERVEITGEGAFLTVDEVTELAYYPPSPNGWRPPTRTVWSPNTALQTTENNSLDLQGYIGEVRAFIEAVRTGIPPEMATIDDGIAAMRLAECIARTPSGTLTREQMEAEGKG